MKRWLVVAITGLGLAIAWSAPASAAPVTSVLAGQTISGSPIPCVTQPDGVRVCHGSDNGGGPADLRLKSFDGVALEVYVVLPPAPATGSDGNYPFVDQSHGWGGMAGGANDTQYYGPTADALAGLRRPAADRARLWRLVRQGDPAERARPLPQRLHPDRRRPLRGA